MGFLIGSSGRPALAAERGIFVERDKLACLVENAGAYLALDEDPLVIFLDTCPDPTPVAAAMAPDRLKEGLPQQQFTDLQSSDSAPVSSLLTLTRAQLNCLVSQAAAIEAQPGSLVRVDSLSCM